MASKSKIDFKEAYDFYSKGNSINITQAFFKKRKESLKKEWLKMGLKYPLKFKKSGYNQNNPRRKEFNLNIDYFKSIDCPDKAYWLGLIAADGNVFIKKCKEKGNKYAFKLTLKECDISLLEHFKYQINMSCDISTVKEKIISLSGKNYTSSKQKVLAIHLRDFVFNLLEQGIIPNKTYLGMDTNKIPKNYLNDFIRGYFDGDGCIGAYTQKTGNIIGRCYIVSKTLTVLKFFHDYLKSLNLNCFIRDYNGLFYLELRQKSILPFWDLIKPKNTKCYLQRKYDKFELFRSLKEQFLKEKSDELLEKQETVNQQPS